MSNPPRARSLSFAHGSVGCLRSGGGEQSKLPVRRYGMRVLIRGIEVQSEQTASLSQATAAARRPSAPDNPGRELTRVHGSAVARCERQERKVPCYAKR